MEITVDRRSTYFVANQTDKATKCHECGHRTLHRDYSSIQLRCSGYTVSAVIPSRRCLVCCASRVAGPDLEILELTAIYVLIKQGLRNHAFLRECRSALGLGGLADVLRFKHDELTAILRNEVELNPQKWELLSEHLLERLHTMTKYRLPIPYRVNTPRAKK